MASSLISAVGTLSNSSSNLRILILSDSSKGLISQKKCCWMKLQSYKKPEQSFGSSYASSNGIFERRKVLLLSAFGFLVRGFQIAPENGVAVAAEYADMPALRGKDYGKTKMRFPDYTETKSGLQYKDLRVGSGSTPKIGDTVVVDWDGYTIGYYGRIFEARNKTKGGSFEGGDKDFMKFTLGSQQVIPAFEEAVSGMSPGGVRRIIVPPELGYPENDYNKQGPRPTTFSVQISLFRAECFCWLWSHELQVVLLAMSRRRWA